MNDPERLFWIELSYRYATPVPRLQDEITSAHFVELIAAERIEPRGERRADLRAGIVAATTANVWRGSNTPAHRPSEFMPEFGGDGGSGPKRVSRRDLGIKLRKMASAMGAAERRRRKKQGAAE